MLAFSFLSSQFTAFPILRIRVMWTMNLTSFSNLHTYSDVWCEQWNQLHFPVFEPVWCMTCMMKSASQYMVMMETMKPFFFFSWKLKWYMTWTVKSTSFSSLRVCMAWTLKPTFASDLMIYFILIWPLWLAGYEMWIHQGESMQWFSWRVSVVHHTDSLFWPTIYFIL